jgi:putative transport protein
MALGSVKVKGVGLGTAGVLFAGILVGHFGKAVDHHTLDFVKEFGLILFVFTIGLQLGPGFLAALQQQGVKLNMLAAAIVLLGAAGAPLAGWFAGFDAAAVLGVREAACSRDRGGLPQQDARGETSIRRASSLFLPPRPRFPR